MLDVAVIGGGPSGSRTAFKLAESGYRVVVLEKKSGIGEKSCCSGIVSHECARLYNIPDEVILRQVNSASIYSPDGDCIHVYRPEIQACILDRSKFDRLLAERAAAAGAKYYLSTAVTNISTHSEHLDIEAETSGKTVHFQTRVAVIASGFNTRLTRKVGLAETGYYVHGAQIECTTSRISEVSVYFNQEVSPGFFSWIIPTDQDRCLVGLLARFNPGPLLHNWTARLESTGIIRSNGSGMRYGSIPLKPLKRTYGERFLVVGDAAGQVKPTTGGGIYFGMLCADIAADTLDTAVSRSDFSVKTMACYEQSWHKILANELKSGYYARRLYERLNNKQINGLFSTLNNSGMIEKAVQRQDLSFDWHGGLLLKAVSMGAAHGVKRAFSLPAGIFRKNKD